MTVLKKQILIITALLFTAFFSCSTDDNSIEENGPVTTKTLSVPDFSGINLTFSSNITITQGDTQVVKVTGHSNIIDKIITSVSDNILKFELEDDYYQDSELSIEITIPNLNHLELNGSGNFLVNDFTNQNKLDILLSGSGNVYLNKFEGITDLYAAISGSGNIKANKKITGLKNLSLNITGSGNYFVFKINSNNCTVNIAGSGHIELTAVKSLNVTISGSGDVYYKGKPSITQNISGSGKLIDAN